MSDRLRIDMSELDQLWRDLCVVDARFSSIETSARDLGVAVGHPRLAGVIHHFESGWDEQRRKIVESMDTLWHQAKAVHQAFEKTDAALAEPLK